MEEFKSDENNKVVTSNISILPLTFEEKSLFQNVCNSTSQLIPCLQCDKKFNFPKSKDDYLGHLFMEHRVVIADVDDIGNIQEYLIYWEKEFKNEDNHHTNALQEYCTTMLLDQLPNGKYSKNERYYLLSDILPKDYEIRKVLHEKRLKNVLKQYQFERSDTKFSRECLYCRDVIIGLRSKYIEHLYNKHFLQLGKSENLVYIDELVNCVQYNLEHLICIFCEKNFKDRATLKEHMRKKGHKRINPDIKFYDKFYLENYKIEKPKYCKNIKKSLSYNNKKKFEEIYNRKHREEEQVKGHLKNVASSSSKYKKNLEIDNDSFCDKLNSDNDTDSDWSDWDCGADDDDDQQKQMPLICFFCNHNDVNFMNLKKHMINEHNNFNFDLLTNSLNFYHKIKLVNYIRRQIHNQKCIMCNEYFKTNEDLLKHMNEMKHFCINDKKQWDRPEYFFPTYEDDGVLCLLDNENNDGDDRYQDTIILSEDLKANINKDAEALSMENFTF